jgi:hypothetical protein
MTNQQPEKNLAHGRKTDRKQNTLHAAQRFKLWQELTTAQGELEATGATYQEAAAMMSQRLGFTVTKSNVQDAVEAGIVNWHRRMARPAVSSKTTARLDDIDSRVLALEDMVLRICRELGTEPSGIRDRNGKARSV